MTKRIAGPRLPIVVTEISYSEAAIWANRLGVSLRDYTEAALDAANRKAARQYQDQLYADACRDADTRRAITPTRHEWDRSRRGDETSATIFGTSEAIPGVRCGDRTSQQSRASMKNPKASLARNPRGVPGPPMRPLRGGASSGIGDGNAMPEQPEDRWGPLPGEVEQPGRTTRLRP